ncbi:MAG: hypothetical protein N3A72_06945 [bacterium]|nr:hypothetical protein [bacterium]
MVNIHFPIEAFYQELEKQSKIHADPVYAVKTALSTLGRPYVVQVDEIVLRGFPLGSLQASGKFRDYIFVTRNGKTYLKPYTKPRNPNTTKQRAQRNKFRQAVQSWKLLSPEEKQAYRNRAKLKPTPMTGISLFCQEQLTRSVVQ